MNKGTTPTITFSTPLKAEDVAAVSVVFAEGDAVLIQKEINDVMLKDYAISFTLTQTETLGLPDNKALEAQLRIKDRNLTVYVSNIVAVDIGRILKAEII